MMSSHIIAIDQGTTSTRSIVFDNKLRRVGVSQQEFAQHFPQSGWVEHDPDDIWRTAEQTVRGALADASKVASDVAAIGITNQRETIVIWDRESGRPVHRAIVWQDRRTADRCAALLAQGCEELVRHKTGLVIDPYFSATKIAWMLDNIDGLRTSAEAGRLAFGTIDTWLIWNLTGGKVHATDASNAARTLLFDIHARQWDDELLDLFGVPRAMLPEVLDCAAEFGTTDPALFGAAIPIRGVAGDQQAALIGQACFEPGMIKSTYGTGCFAVLNTGSEPVVSNNRLLTTIGYQLNGKPTYALEGSIFIAGAAVQWLRDGLKIITHAGDTQAMAQKADQGHHVYLVPAFVGLGAPHWDAEARGAIFGLTRNSGPAELARAALESVGYQTRDLLEAMRKDWPQADTKVLRVDGGMTASDWTMQFLSDILGVPVDRPKMLETTALGAAYLAGLQSDLYPQPEQFAAMWQLDRQFQPSMPEERRERLYTGWLDALQRTLTHQAT
ncbi:glycerol kinase GlpK [Thiosocius teredinicola]|uniref:glycerol kinase GlpK n=1 Tax=Thiosocius teredinicola TaxID=1973002 RepID=UPI002FE45085